MIVRPTLIVKAIIIIKAIMEVIEMRNKIWIILAVIALMVIITGTAAAFAQSASGAILGTVYNDQNADGVCVGTGEPGLPGMVIEFNNVEAAILTALQTNENGSYGYTAAGFGTWNVTVKPPQGWRSTAQSTRQVALTSTQPVVSGLDFCITQGSSTAAPTATPGSGGSGGAVTLPESGAPIAPALLVGALIGIGLLALGAGLFVYSRRASSR
jgi:hypothetical protein